MFVGKLTREQLEGLVRNIVPETVYRFQLERRRYKEEYWEIFLYDKEVGNYSICLYDTYVTCKYKPCNYPLKVMAEKAFKELYGIFGEEYKNYFLEKVNNIFN